MEAQPCSAYRILGICRQEWAGTEEFVNSGYAFAATFQGFQPFCRANVVDEVVSHTSDQILLS